MFEGNPYKFLIDSPGNALQTWIKLQLLIWFLVLFFCRILVAVMIKAERVNTDVLMYTKLKKEEIRKESQNIYCGRVKDYS
jgi:hypothetical protein